MRRVAVALLGIIILLVANAAYIATMPLRIVSKVWDDMRFQYTDFVEHSFNNIVCVFDYLAARMLKKGGDL